MKEYDDEDLEFDDDLPELDLSDLDFMEEEKEDEPPKYQLKKYENDADDSEEFAALIKQEAFKALDIPEEEVKLPKTYTLDEEDDDAEYFDYTEEDFDTEEEKKVKTGGLVGKILLGILLALMVSAALLVLTEPGRNFLYNIAGSWVKGNMETDPSLYTHDDEEYPSPIEERTDLPTIVPLDEDDPTPTPMETVKTDSEFRSADYVKSYLLFGVEEIGGAANTDAILVMSVNTKEKTIKLTSLMRDTFVEIPGYYPNKINAAYASGMRKGDTIEEQKKNGAQLLLETIQKNYDIELTGYIFVNFKSFEKIIDRLGGIDLELGSSEASYLCTTNYISNPAYRYVHSGWNHMNGNQVLGYCRVRKRPTLGGANNDYGRTLRHRRVITAVINQYKSLPLTEMYSALKDCLGYFISNLTEEEISEMIHDVVENKIFTVENMRLPIDGKFRDSGKKGKFNGKINITYALDLDGYWDENLNAFHEFVFGKEEEEEVTPVLSPTAAGE